MSMEKVTYGKLPEILLLFYGMPMDIFGMVRFPPNAIFANNLTLILLSILGYEVTGIEHLPDDSAALIIYYHGAIPIDLYYCLAKVFLAKNRLVHTVADRFLFKIPGKLDYTFLYR